MPYLIVALVSGISVLLLQRSCEKISEGLVKDKPSIKPYQNKISLYIIIFVSCIIIYFLFKKGVLR